MSLEITTNNSPAHQEYLDHRAELIEMRDSGLGRIIIARELDISTSKARRWLVKLRKEEAEAAFGEETIVNLAKSNQSFSDKNRIIRKVNRDIIRRENAIAEYSEKMIEVISSKSFKGVTKMHKCKPGGVGIIHLSDAHFNEIVDLPFNSFDFHVAAKRMQMFAAKAKKVFTAYGVSHVFVAITGDMLNSDRRIDELMAQSTNRSRASFIAVDILQQFIRDVNSDFNVSVGCVIGNESRVNPEMGWTDEVASDSYDYTIFNILRLLFKESDGIEFVVGGCVELVVNLNGYNILLLHGNGSIKVNVEKSVDAIRGRYAAQGVNLDYIIFGHKHGAMIGDTFARSSSLVGANSFSENSLGATSRASQNIYILQEDGNIDGMKVDLQNVEKCSGYPIDEEIAHFNVRKEASSRKVDVVVKVKT